MKYSLDAKSATITNSNYWNFCIGSCHAATALREDWRKQLKQAHDEIGFRYVRFHGLLNDDMCVIRKSLLGDYVLSFVNIDSIFDFLLSIGMKPFIEIGFMPSCLKSADEYLFHYKANVTPPADEDRWRWLIDNFIRHIIDRYGRDEIRKWYFEIWNEPNLCKDSGFKGGRFWSGSKEDYFRLYTITVNAIKSVDASLKVGGPATSNNAWIPDMLDYCESSGTPIDFVTTHHYPTDIVLGYGVEDSQNFVTAFNNATSKDELQKILGEYLVFQSGTWEKVDRGVLTDMTKRAVSECRGLPLYYTEWSSLAGIDSDGPFGASFIAKTVQDNMGLVEGYSYWTFSDIVEEKGMTNCEFHGGFGLMTYDGVRKAPYNAFRLLAKLGSKRYVSVYRNGTVDIYGFNDEATNSLQILAVNHQSLMHNVSEETITVHVDNADILENADIIRVDDTHANALAKWQELGNPQYVDNAQRLILHSASELTRESVAVTNNEVTFVLPKQGIALITLYKK